MIAVLLVSLAAFIILVLLILLLRSLLIVFLVFLLPVIALLVLLLIPLLLLSLKAVSSVLETYRKIIGLAISKHDSDEMRKICGRYLGLFVLTYYPQIESNLNIVENIRKEFGVPLHLPERRVLKVLRLFLGWEKSVALMHKMDLIKIPD